MFNACKSNHYLPLLSGEDIYKFSVEASVDSCSKEDPLLEDPRYISEKRQSLMRAKNN